MPLKRRAALCTLECLRRLRGRVGPGVPCFLMGVRLRFAPTGIAPYPPYPPAGIAPSRAHALAVRASGREPLLFIAIKTDRAQSCPSNRVRAAQDMNMQKVQLPYKLLVGRAAGFADEEDRWRARAPTIAPTAAPAVTPAPCTLLPAEAWALRLSLASPWKTRSLHPKTYITPKHMSQ